MPGTGHRMPNAECRMPNAGCRELASHHGRNPEGIPGIPSPLAVAVTANEWGGNHRPAPVEMPAIAEVQGRSA